MLKNRSLLIAFSILVLLNSRPVQAVDLSIQAREATTSWRKMVGSLRNAIQDLKTSYRDRYPNGPEFLARLASLDQAWEMTPGPNRPRLQNELATLRREALLANPLVCGQPILFVVRRQYLPDHHNTETMFQTGEICAEKFQGGGALKLIDLLGGKVKTLLELPQGVARDPEVSFDGTRILFSLRRHPRDDYHLYEIQADGTGLRQLTTGSGLSDIDPIYLPDGRILFTSTREPKYCMCNRHIMGNLYTMEADGSNLLQIGHNTLHEGHPSLLPDGRVIYDRWEYVDRNFGDSQGVWVCHPDGTNHAAYWGNHMNSPGVVLDARAVPGTDLFISTFSSCHDRPWGALALVDPRRAIDGRAAVLRTWPEEAINLVDRGTYDTFSSVRPKYEDPYPLSDKYFLCSRMTGQGEQMALYLIDVFGNEVLVHAEATGCFDPMPLGSRLKPPIIPSRVDLARKEGYFYVSDVYVGTGMDKVERGSVKALRVVESPPKRFWTNPAWDGGTGQQAPGMAWDDFNNKRILGTVPIQADGSAYFAVPADTFLYFQLLDEQGRMIQSMRSGTMVRPGETAGCIGCHEDRRAAAGGKSPGQIHRQRPQPLQPWYGPARLFSYTREVQPVFDRHCLRCHDYGQEAGRKLNLAGDLGLVFNTSYVELRGKGLVHVVGAGPFQVQRPRTWGSAVSRLATILLQGHGRPEIDRQVHPDRESLDRVLTWIDINAPYYPDYAGGAFRDHPFGRSPLTHEETAQLGRLVGRNLLDRSRLGDISFTRPERSPCLDRLPHDRRYQEALALIQRGRQRLTDTPRLDMPGFQMVSPVEISQEKKSQKRAQEEAVTRAALLRGQKHFPQEAGSP